MEAPEVEEGSTTVPAMPDEEIPVVVAVHLRPLIYDELMQGCQECLRVTEGEPQVSTTAFMMLLRVFP